MNNTKVFFFFNDTATTEIYTLSLHDALPISVGQLGAVLALPVRDELVEHHGADQDEHPENKLSRDRKSTRLNSSHANISYAVFCLKKKNINLPPFASPTSSAPSPFFPAHSQL